MNLNVVSMLLRVTSSVFFNKLYSRFYSIISILESLADLKALSASISIMPVQFAWKTIKNASSAVAATNKETPFFLRLVSFECCCWFETVDNLIIRSKICRKQCEIANVIFLRVGWWGGVGL